jgi:hypothetical protein
LGSGNSEGYVRPRRRTSVDAQWHIISLNEREGREEGSKGNQKVKSEESVLCVVLRRWWVGVGIMIYDEAERACMWFPARGTVVDGRSDSRYQPGPASWLHSQLVLGIVEFHK